MTDTQEYLWIKHYPEGVPATINPDIYESLPDSRKRSVKSTVMLRSLPAWARQ